MNCRFLSLNLLFHCTKQKENPYISFGTINLPKTLDKIEPQTESNYQSVRTCISLIKIFGFKRIWYRMIIIDLRIYVNEPKWKLIDKICRYEVLCIWCGAPRGMHNLSSVLFSVCKNGHIFYIYYLVQMNLISNDGHRSKPQQDIDFWSAPIQIKISSYNLEVRIGSELEPFWCQFCSRVVQSMFGQIGGDSVVLHGSDLIVRTELLNSFQLMSRVWFYSDGQITRTKFLTISKLL